MTTVYEPKLELPVGAVSPDSYDGLHGLIPPDSFVVSRNRDGTAASTYGDIFWNLSAYQSEGRACGLHFNYWSNGEPTLIRDQLSRECRWIMFALMWKREGASLSIGTLTNYLSVVSALALFAENNSCCLQDILTDSKRLLVFADTRCSGWMTQTLGSLLPLLAKMGEWQLGFDIVGDRMLQELRTRGRKYRTTLKQHAPIPTRIYTTIISNLSHELAEWEKLAEDILPLLTASGKDPLWGRLKETQQDMAKKIGCAWELRPEFEEVAAPCIKEYLKKNDTLISVRGASVVTAEAQLAAKLTIQTFTGMRDDEALSLPYHCLETTVSNGKTHYIILGRTTKLNNGRIKRTRWVTNREGYQAVLIAKRIADAIYAVFDVEAKKDVSKTNDHPLFVSTSYLGLAGKTLKPKDGHFFSGHLFLTLFDGLRKRLQPLIDDADLRELDGIDPHRAWSAEEKFKIGNPWVLTSHQLRRSLALYAQRSGLVSLPSLRRQLQHITDEMSRYYARGSAYALNFIGHDKDHFGLEWQETQSESAGLSYVLNVLLSNDVLFGGHANWVKHRLHGEDGTVLVDRESTIKRFKKGEMAYKETSLGGCTNVGDCDQIVLKWMDVDCIREGCRNMVGNLTKLERVITAQDRLVSSLDPESLEYRSEKDDLDVLVSARDKALLQQNGVSNDSTTTS